MSKLWDKKESSGITVWRNKADPSYTVEIVSFKSQDVDMDGWGYGYPAYNRKGLFNTANVFSTKKEAISWASQYMKDHPVMERPHMGRFPFLLR